MSLLHIAAARDRAKVAQVLLEHKADMNTTTVRCTVPLGCKV